MKKIILILCMILIFSTNVFADSFQFRRQNGSLAVGAAVYFNGSLLGYTNVQGIIILTSPQGRNRCSIIHMKITTEVELSITGNSQLQIIYIQ